MKDNDPWEMGSIAGDFNNYPSLVLGESFQAVVQEENQSRMQWSLKVEQMELGVGEMKLRERSKLLEFAEQRTREEKTSQKERTPQMSRSAPGSISLRAYAFEEIILDHVKNHR